MKQERNIAILISLPLVWPLQKVFSKKKYFENNKILEKSILKIQNKILFGIFKIKYYFENTILHITGRQIPTAYDVEEAYERHLQKILNIRQPIGHCLMHCKR